MDFKVHIQVHIEFLDFKTKLHSDMINFLTGFKWDSSGPGKFVGT